MNAGFVVATACLGTLAVGHSALGEWKILGPLLRSDLPGFTLGATFAKRVLRFAWHLTSIAWIALAACLWVAPASAAIVGAGMLVSSVVTLVGARGRHFAWALFAAGGLGALHRYQDGPAPTWLAYIGAATAAALALLHVAWALGVTWGLEASIPNTNGRRRFEPGPAAALAVAVALAVLAIVFLGLGGVVTMPGVSWLALAAAIVFCARTIGDFRHFGLFGHGRGDAFSRNDAMLYTPLCFALAASLMWLR